MLVNFEQINLNGSTPNLISFGPDICGGENKIKIEINSHGYKLQFKTQYEVPDDKLVHLYRLEISPDNTYKLFFDYNYIHSGSLITDFDFDPKIDPESEDAKNIYNIGSIGGVAFEIFQLKAGTTFDNIMISNSVEEADVHNEEHFNIHSIQKIEEKRTKKLRFIVKDKYSDAYEHCRINILTQSIIAFTIRNYDG